MDLNNLHGDTAIPAAKTPLKFKIEGKQYETFQQYMTGAELKNLAGIPLETELFLSIRLYKNHYFWYDLSMCPIIP